ncbi:MAG: Bug family tripartite tricarboxylate transporter substrate binding protein [Burkholderiales bacterium]
MPIFAKWQARKRVADRVGLGWYFALRYLFPIVALAVPIGSAQGQSYPNKPIRIVTGYAAGGGADIVGRLFAEHIAPKLSQTVIVENRTGAGTNIASEYVARAAPDGYTLLLTSNNHNLNSLIYSNPGYDPVRDLAPVIELVEGASLLSAHPSAPFDSLKALVDFARQKPRSLSYGNFGVGTPVHMAMELFKLAAGIDVVHVPYRGAGQSVVDAVGGHIPLVIGSIASMKPHIDSGKLRPLAVSTSQRATNLPNVPTMAESGFTDAVHRIWLGILVPAGTPPNVVARLNKEMAAVLLNPAVRDKLDAIGFPAVDARSPQDFEAMLKADFAMSQRIVSHLKLKAD